MQSSLPSGVYLNPACTTASALAHASRSSSSSPSQNQSGSGFTDHYAILALDVWATSEEIKTAYRKLRAEYFRTDATKYRALQAAFDVLADREARWAYDREYRAWRGLPSPPTPLAMGMKGVNGKKGYAQGGVADRRKMFEDRSKANIQAGAGVPAKQDSVWSGVHSSDAELARASQQADDAINAFSDEVCRLEDAVDALGIDGSDDADSNWALKNFSVEALNGSVLGTMPYPSFVPVLVAYEGRTAHPRWKCSRPRYVGNMARLAFP